MLGNALWRLHPLKEFLNQVDAPARAIQLITGQLVSWASGITKTAVHAATQNLIRAPTTVGGNKALWQIGLH
jgi:hypothetical protein